MTVKAIDISAWQGKVGTSTFQNNRKSIPCVILRSSWTAQGSSSRNKDKVFENNVKTAYKAGMKIGAYHYSQAISVAEAKKEAQYTINVLKPYKSYITLPVAFDWEFGGRLSSYMAAKLGKAKCGEICEAFCKELKAAGYKVMVYANLSTLNGYLPSDLYKRCPIWVAQYNSKCNYKHDHIAWQYSSSGRVSGIDGRIDMNWWYGNDYTPPPKTTYKGAFPKLPKRGWFSSGDRGEEVKKLQKFLNWYGGYGLVVDGIVGAKTIDAVRQYQGREKLKIDGSFGPESLKRAKVVLA